MFYTFSRNDLVDDSLPPQSRYCFLMIETSSSAGNLSLEKQVTSDYHNMVDGNQFMFATSNHGRYF